MASAHLENPNITITNIKELGSHDFEISLKSESVAPFVYLHFDDDIHGTFRYLKTKIQNQNKDE